MATKLRQLADQISLESRPILRQRGISTDPKTISVLMFVAGKSRTTTAEIARALGLSHQLATQRVNRLLDQQLIEIVSDSSDSRLRPVQLAAEGEAEVRQLTPVIEQLDAVLRQVFEEIDSDPVAIANDMFEALSQHSLQTRIDVAEGYTPDQDAKS